MNILENLTDKSNLQKLWSIFPSARLVGGAVRDLLIKRPVSDIDMATPEAPDLILDKLKKAEIKAIPTGIAHGTITAIVNHCSYEITTLRKDIKTDGRHAQVAWTDNWQEDAARRDFTINALYCDQTGKIWDFYQGQEDLVQGRVRFIGEAEARINEDFLRILRFFRFYARYGQGKPNKDAIKAIQKYAMDLRLLSAERIWSELQKIITGPKANEIISMMDDYKVLPVVMPFDYSLHNFDQLIRIGVPSEVIVRLAGLVKVEAYQVSRQLKLSRQQTKFLQALQKPLPLSVYDTDKQLIQFRADYDLDVLLGKSWLEQIKTDSSEHILWTQWRERVALIPQPVFPLSGKDLLALGIEKGPVMGKTLYQIRKWWLDGGCIATIKECIEWFKNHT